MWLRRSCVLILQSAFDGTQRPPRWIYLPPLSPHDSVHSLTHFTHTLRHLASSLIASACLLFCSFGGRLGGELCSCWHHCAIVRVIHSTPLHSTSHLPPPFLCPPNLYREWCGTSPLPSPCILSLSIPYLTPLSESTSVLLRRAWGSRFIRRVPLWVLSPTHSHPHTAPPLTSPSFWSKRILGPYF